MEKELQEAMTVGEGTEVEFKTKYGHIVKLQKSLGTILDQYFSGTDVEPFNIETLDEPVTVQVKLGIKSLVAIRMLQFESIVNGSLLGLDTLGEAVETIAHFVLTGEDVHEEWDYYVGEGYRGYIEHVGKELLDN